jgi:antitoxin ParD1/3/4
LHRDLIPRPVRKARRPFAYAPLAEPEAAAVQGGHHRLRLPPGGQSLLFLAISLILFVMECGRMNMNVSLTEELANFVKAKVSAGRYSSSSEVVREALRLMEKTERQEAEKLRFLRAAWKEGLDSGEAGEVDFSALKREARARLAVAKA